MSFNWGKFAGNMLETAGDITTGYGNMQQSKKVYESFGDLIETEDNPRRKQMLKTIQSGVNTTLGGNMKGVAGMGAITAMTNQQNRFFDTDQDMVKTMVQQANQNKRSTEYADAVSGRNTQTQKQQMIRTLKSKLADAIDNNGSDSPEVRAIRQMIEEEQGGGSGSSGGSGGVLPQFDMRGPFDPSTANYGI